MHLRYHAARGLALVALLAPAPWLLARPAGGAGADAPAGFRATAVAQSVRVTVIVPRLLVVETLADVGGMVSQADLSPLGGQAFASSVYPGDPATAGQAAGAAGLPRPPDYPLYVAASHPSAPEAQTDPPGQHLSATATETGSSGRATAGATSSSGATDGPPLGTLESTSVARRSEDGSVVARAESLVEGAVFPGGLTLGGIHSVVTATLRPGAAAPEVEAATTVTGAAVGDTPIEIGPDGITSPGPAGLPAGTLTPLEQQLHEAGTSVRRLGATPVEGGGSTDVIEVRVNAAPAAPGLPEGIVIYRLAGATAAVNVGAAGGGGPVLPEPPAATVPDSQPGPGDVVSTASSPLPATVPAPAGPRPGTARRGGDGPSPTAVAASDNPAPPTAGDTGSALVAPAATEAAAPLMPRPALAGAGSDGLGTLRARYGQLYLVLILAALAGFAVSAVFRAKGAQARWS
jgi:hypothetical protein